MTLILFCNTGYAQCSFANNLIIGTERTGRSLKGKPEWSVQVINNCSCAQSQILLKCGDFKSLVAIDPSIFRKAPGDKCLVNNGGPIPPHGSVKFSYVWDPPSILFPAASKVVCWFSHIGIFITHRVVIGSIVLILPQSYLLGSSICLRKGISRYSIFS